MENNVIAKNILVEMADYLDINQMRKLQDVILREFSKSDELEREEISNEEFGYATAMKVILENGLYLEFQKQLGKMKKKAD